MPNYIVDKLFCDLNHQTEPWNDLTNTRVPAVENVTPGGSEACDKE